MPSTKPYNPGFKRLAARIKREAEYVCAMCERQCYRPGEKVLDTRYVLTVHHKNGDSLDDREENLDPLCSVCHLRVEAYMKVVFKRVEKIVRRAMFFLHEDEDKGGDYNTGMDLLCGLVGIEVEDLGDCQQVNIEDILREVFGDGSGKRRSDRKE